MQFAIKCFIFVSLYVIGGANYVSINSLQDLFNGRRCIEGTIHTLATALDGSQSQNKQFSSLKELAKDLPVSESETVTVPEKTALTKLQELAQYNQIHYYFELEQEEVLSKDEGHQVLTNLVPSGNNELIFINKGRKKALLCPGPSHKKLFTVKLMLGNEEYKAKDRSLKKTKQAAAAIALENTEYQHPPYKTKLKQTLTPTVLLNNLATKLGVAVSYHIITDTLESALNAEEAHIADERLKKSYLQKLNDSVHLNDSIRIRKDESGLHGPFRVKVKVDGEVFVGEGHTIQTAKHDAAAKALNSYKKRNHDDFDCLKDGNEEICKDRKKKVASPISQVFEAAQLRGLPVAFDIIDETGPAHKKNFITECQLGDLKTTGEGGSKKESKRVAAERMLENFHLLPEVSHSGSYRNLGKKKKKKSKKNKVIKSNFEKVNMMFDNILEYGTEMLNKVGKKDDDDVEVLQNRKPPPQKNLKSAADEIVEIGNLINIEIQFSDNSEGEQQYSLLSMGLKPSFVCFGLGISQKESREKAAKGAINLLYKLGYLDNVSEKLESVTAKEEETGRFVWVDTISKNDKDEL